MDVLSEKTHEPLAFKRRMDVSRPMTSTNVQFVATAPFQLQIKHAMKTSATIQHKPIIPSLFQIASRVEDFAPANTSKSAPPPNETPFANLMLHPEKLAAALKAAKSQNDAFDASRTTGQSPAKRATPSATSKNHDDTITVW